MRTAKKRVILIDNFVDDRTLLLLDKRAAGVEATVYTRYSEKSELDFAKHNAQYEPVQRVQLPHAVHDRYLIVDDDVWLLGSSVKDMGRGLLSWAKYQRKRIKVGENDYICRVLNYEIYGEGKF